MGNTESVGGGKKEAQIASPCKNVSLTIALLHCLLLLCTSSHTVFRCDIVLSSLFFYIVLFSSFFFIAFVSTTPGSKSVCEH